MQTLGIRHIALNVADPQASKKFYVDTFGMTVEWEPDPENVYLTSGGQDNLAIHKAQPSDPNTQQRLDHIGFALATIDSVDTWFERVTKLGVKIVHDPKTHRDGARSFYCADPNGVVIQMIYHPPIAERAKRV